MPEPIEYQIVKHLQAAIAAISVASGYFFTIAASAVRVDPNVDIESLVAPGGPRPYAVLEVNSDAEAWDHAEQRGGVLLVFPVVVNWVSDSVPTDDDSRLKTFFRGCADIEQAIAVDRTRGGLASDTTIVRRVQDLTRDGAEVWARVELSIRLRREFGKPNG